MGLLSSENGSRYRGVSQLQSHQSRYSVQLSSGKFGVSAENLHRKPQSGEVRKNHFGDPIFRAALKGTNLRGQTPICGFLRVPAVFCVDMLSSGDLSIF